MADHTLNTRIKLKYDTYANWVSNNPKLLSGEVAIAYVETEHDTAVTNFQNIPNVVLKVGDGEHYYNDLKFVSALAADVYGWAKAANKPEYEAKEIKGLETFIGEKVQDTNTQYTIVKVNNYQYKLQKKELGEEAFADTGVVIDLPNDTTDISALQAKFDGMTETTVVAHVAAEIAKLNIAEYAKKTEVQGVQTNLTNYQNSNNAVIAAIKDHGTVDSFNDVMTEMAKYQLAGDYATKTEAQGYANAKDTAIQAAQDAANAVGQKLGDISELKTTNKTTAVDAINEIKDAVDANANAAKVTMTTDTTTDGALKSYTLKQGDTNIGTIDIPKDMVVESGEVVVDPEGQVAGTYIKLKLANVTEPLYINVGTLVDIYKAKDGATQVQITVDNSTREISAALVANSVNTAELINGAVTTDKIANDAVTTAKILNKNVTKDKLDDNVQASLEKADAAAGQITEAINALDVEDTAVEGQFVTRVSETDGKIAVERAVITTDHITQGTNTLIFDCGSSVI